MKRFLAIIVLAILLGMPFTSTAMTESPYYDSPIILNSTWNANEAYGKAAVRILYLMLACVVGVGLEALGKQIKSNLKERKAETNQSEKDNETSPNAPTTDASPSNSSTVTSVQISQTEKSKSKHISSEEALPITQAENSETAQETIVDSFLNVGNIRFCRKCGKRLFPDSVFCDQCGTKVEQ